MKKFSAIDAIIIIAIAAIISAIFATGLQTQKPSHETKPEAVKPAAYDGWTFVTDGPRGHSYYMKRIHDMQCTIWFDGWNGSFVVVKD